MIQNIKVDIIYYKTGTDFEMEFNLGGCCRMRLLTGKASDRKTAVQSLARAVSRSKVIMVAGPLFGKNGVINIVASAIGSKVVPVDKKSYNIDTSEEIEIINGATPLITPEGFFGGCIIENGPQTMILLSDSKNIRKTIMHTLIHPYIEELFAAEHKDKHFTIANMVENIEPALDETEKLTAEDTETENDTEELSEEENEEIAEEVPQEETEITEEAEASDQEIPEDTEEGIITDSIDETESVIPANGETTQIIIDEEALENSDFNEDVNQNETENNEPEDTVILSGGMDFDSEDNTEEKEDEEFELFINPMRMKRRDAKLLNQSYNDFEEDNPIHADEDEEYEIGMKKSKSLDLPILIISIILLILIATLCYCIFYVPTQYGMTSSEYIRNIFNTLFG